MIQNWKKGKTTWVFADEFYLLFRYQYSADFFYRLYKRIRKYHGFVTSLTQNVEELLKSDTARLMLANSEFLILLNQATTDRDEDVYKRQPPYCFKSSTNASTAKE